MKLILLGIFGGQELILVVILVLILFGGKKIPELMRGLGRGINEFNKGKSGIEDEIKKNVDPDSK